jgi:hypothetical protein
LFSICSAVGGLIANGDMIMKKTVITTLLLASTLAISASGAFAQSTFQRNPWPHAGADGRNGEARETAYGQGGSAGTYQTGANVGPGRAAMIHAN